MVKIWTYNGDVLDGTTTENREAAVEAIRNYYGWAEAHLCEICGGSAVAVFKTKAEAEADAEAEAEADAEAEAEAEERRPWAPVVEDVPRRDW